MGFSAPTPAILTYLPETTLYVNSGSGNDSGAGTISDPLQSLGQAVKNIWARRLNGNLDHCTVFLSGNTGDADVTNPVVYYWPGSYWGFAVTGYDLANWDGSDTETGVDAVTPATLFSGSSVYGQTFTTDMTTFDGGPIVTLSTDVGGSTPTNFEAGTTAPMAQGWWIVDDNLQNNPYDGRRPIGHASAANQIRICSKYDGAAETWAWTSAVRGELKIGKPGVTIDFIEMVDAAAGAGVWGGSGKTEWYNIHISSSSTQNPRAGLSMSTQKWELWQCRLDFDVIGAYQARVIYYNTYVAPNDNHNPGQNDGWSEFQGCVLDGQKQYPPLIQRFWRGQGLLEFGAYNILQNYNTADDLVFGRNTRVLNADAPDVTVLHLTNSVGFKGPTISYSGEPIRIIGRINSVQDYSLSLTSGSVWQWHSGSIVMQDDGTTEALVSIDNGETQGSADIPSNTFIFNYTSSIDRDSGPAANYPTFANDYSSSLAAVEFDANN